MLSIAYRPGFGLGDTCPAGALWSEAWGRCLPADWKPLPTTPLPAGTDVTTLPPGIDPAAAAVAADAAASAAASASAMAAWFRKPGIWAVVAALAVAAGGGWWLLRPEAP